MVYSGQMCLAFAIGFGIGVFLAFTLFSFNVPHIKVSFGSNPVRGISQDELYGLWLKSLGLQRRRVEVREKCDSKESGVETEADFLYKTVPVTCVIFVKSLSNAYTVRYTWGERCNTLIFYTEKQDKYLESTELKSRNSWGFLCEAVYDLWRQHRKNLKWVVILGDDVYLIPENLRLLLAPKNSSLFHYLGHNSVFWNQLYNSARAGIVLSRPVIRAFVTKFDTVGACTSSVKYNNNEDYYLGKFLSEMGIWAEDTRDDKGRERFHEFTPAQLMAPGNPNVLQKYSKRSLHVVTQGWDCCSPTSITFQGTEKDLIFLYTYLLYTIQVFLSGHPSKPKLYTRADQVWERFVIEELGPEVNLSKITADFYYKMWTVKEFSPEEFNRKIRDEVLGGSKRH